MTLILDPCCAQCPYCQISPHVSVIFSLPPWGEVPDPGFDISAGSGTLRPLFPLSAAWVPHNHNNNPPLFFSAWLLSTLNDRSPQSLLFTTSSEYPSNLKSGWTSSIRAKVTTLEKKQYVFEGAVVLFLWVKEKFKRACPWYCSYEGVEKLKEIVYVWGRARVDRQQRVLCRYVCTFAASSPTAEEKSWRLYEGIVLEPPAPMQEYSWTFIKVTSVQCPGMCTHS